MGVKFWLICLMAIFLVSCQSDFPPEPDAPGTGGQYYRYIGDWATEANTTSASLVDDSGELYLRVEGSADFVYAYFYYWDDSTQNWRQIEHADKDPSSSWIQGNADSRISLTEDELDQISSLGDEVFVVSYACQRISAGFDCNGGRWQLEILDSNVFEITETEGCSKEYAPVCGEVVVQCVTAPCDPVLETFGNRCMLDLTNATYKYDGECVEDVDDCVGNGITSCVDFDNKGESELRDEIVAYWNFDKGPFSEITEDFTQRYDGDVYGATLMSESGCGYSYYFDGVDDVIDVPNTENNLLFPFKAPLTISFWAKFNESDSGTVVGKYDGTAAEHPSINDPGLDEGYSVIFGSENYGLEGNKYSILSTNNNERRFHTEPQDYADDQWHHVVAVYESPSKFMYIDGELVSSITMKQFDIKWAHFAIGAADSSPGSWDGHVQAEIDEVGVWERAFTGAEAESLYMKQRSCFI